MPSSHKRIWHRFKANSLFRKGFPLRDHTSFSRRFRRAVLYLRPFTAQPMSFPLACRTEVNAVSNIGLNEFNGTITPTSENSRPWATTTSTRVRT